MKLRNKLILSCAALAAVATTAVSSTYAWYTSNREVTAGTITGQTASNGDDLLLISTSGIANSWSSSADITRTVALTPVYKNASGEFKVMAVDSNGVEDVTGAATGGYIQFDLYFKSGNDNDLTVQFKQFNLTVANQDSYLAKSTLTTTGIGSVGATYSANLLRALTMEISEGNTLEAQSGKTVAAPGTTVDTAYQFDGAASGDTLAGQSASGYNAHTYYNAVLGTHITTSADGSIAYRTGSTTEGVFTPGTDTREDLYAPATGTAKVDATDGSCTGWSFTNSTGSGTAGDAGQNDTGVSILKVHFEIYLDGWDFACFDACQGQEITLSMVFESPLAQNNG